MRYSFLEILPLPVLCLTVSVLAFPRMELDGREYDFGRIMASQKATHNFTFYNRGDDTLAIESVRATCTCTVAMSSKKALAPGENGMISVSFDPKDLSGKFEEVVSITSNDPGTSPVLLIIRGTVIVGITSTPNEIYIDLDKKEGLVRRALTVQNVSNEKIRILSISISSPRIKLIRNPPLPISIEAGKEQRIEFDIASRKSTRSWIRLGEIRIVTDSESNPNLNIPVYASHRTHVGF